MKRLIYFAGGVLAMVLALLGVVLPLLPTTPFVLVAAWCFARSSRRFHQMLINHRLFGPLIQEWEAHGVIPLRIKWLGTTMMLVMVSYPLIFGTFALWLKALAACSVIVALCYIWTRPSIPAEQS